MKLINNGGIEIECDDKAVCILTELYSEGTYKMVWGDFDKAEDLLINNQFALWEMSWSNLLPHKNLNILNQLKWYHTT